MSSTARPGRKPGQKKKKKQLRLQSRWKSGVREKVAFQVDPFIFQNIKRTQDAYGEILGRPVSLSVFYSRALAVFQDHLAETLRDPKVATQERLAALSIIKQ